MIGREMDRRKTARSLNLGEVLEEEDRSEEQSQCSTCKTFCYLSQVACQCTADVSCVEHASQLCECEMSQRFLRKRFSDGTLLDTLAQIEERAAVPTAWRESLSDVLSKTSRPQLSKLRALLAEGEAIDHPMQELAILRKCVVRANQWFNVATSLLDEKQLARDTQASKSTVVINGAKTKPRRGAEGIHRLLDEVADLGFDCPEIAALKGLADRTAEIQERARVLLAAMNSDGKHVHLQDAEDLLEDVGSFHLDITELQEIKKMVAGQQLAKELHNHLVESTPLSLDEVQQLISRAASCDLPEDHHQVAYLKRKEIKGKKWVEGAATLLTRTKGMEELDEFIAVDFANTPVDHRLYDRLKTSRRRAEDFEKQAKVWLSADPANRENRPRVQDAMRLVVHAEEEFNLPAVVSLKQTAEFASDLESRCEEVLKGRYVHNDPGNIFDVLCRWQAYGREHLAMFAMPQFDRLDNHLKLHFRWLETLPWYCRQHMEPHGKQILEDVVESTKPEDDLPPSDEYYTCICTNAVRPPPPGASSDAVQCDHCFARFHGPCAANGRSCPFCDHRHWDGSMYKERAFHFVYLPSILFSAPEISKNYSEDWKHLQIIVHRVDRIIGVIGQFLSFASQGGNQRPEYIPQVRHFMRKLFRMQFVVGPAADQSYGMDLAGLHRILAGQPAPTRVSKKRKRPKFQFGQDVDKDWADGTRCICRGRTSYLLNYPQVECETCTRIYHGGCVFYPVDPLLNKRPRFICPLCCIRKGRPYAFAEVRIKDPSAFHSDMNVTFRHTNNRLQT
jgi:[histone H3]-trimethyl-L-lysine4 demethylase